MSAQLNTEVSMLQASQTLVTKWENKLRARGLAVLKVHGAPEVEADAITDCPLGSQDCGFAGSCSGGKECLRDVLAEHLMN
jgi:hypothetical protein